MSHMAIKTTVSLITLNALLQIYESQAVEFFNTQMTHPKMYSLIGLPSFVNIFLSLLGFQSRSALNGFSAAVLIQNFIFQLPKTLNMILIYTQMMYIGYLILNMINHYFETYVQYQKATQKTLENLIEPEVVKVKKVLKEKRRKAPKKVKMEVDQISQIDQVDQQSVCSMAELKKQESEFAETENAQTCDINHADLSQISSVKIEPKLQFGITTTTGTTTVTSTFETFDSSFDFLNYSVEQLSEVKTHILLNLYDDNEDSCCRLWVLNKLLSMQK